MISLHTDERLFQEAVRFTVAQTEFSARLIEKDYFCSVLLEYLRGLQGEELIFKGGTCLAKIHANFYRMSEDLDFAIPMAIGASRSDRSKKMIQLKRAVEALPRTLSCFSIIRPITGANDSSEYVGTVGYRSVVDGQVNNIRIEISLREPLLTPATGGHARTLLLDPILIEPSVQPLLISCISKSEAVAEKFRAALTRREAAIRDFYDIDYMVQKEAIQIEDKQLIRLVTEKLKVPGNGPVLLGKSRYVELQAQIETRLKPVLRDKDYSDFHLERAYRTVEHLAECVG